MAQSIKFNDNTYIDASGVYDRTRNATQLSLNTAILHYQLVNGNWTYTQGSRGSYERFIRAGMLRIIHFEIVLTSAASSWTNVAQLNSSDDYPQGESFFTLTNLTTSSQCARVYINSAGTLIAVGSISAGTWIGDCVYVSKLI